MIEPDTIRLLRECDAGVKMGAASIGGVLEHARDEGLRQCLESGKKAHEALQAELEGLLAEYHDRGRSPPPPPRACRGSRPTGSWAWRTRTGRRPV